MRQYETIYHLWRETVDGPDLSRELREIQHNPPAIADRFWKDLAFGTGGLRGELGAGTNRMNLYTVGRATQGLAAYLLGQTATPSVCIAYDTRLFSLEFARLAAWILCANGIRTFLFDDVRPTPMLSFAVRRLGADAGIVITASHNPKQYNGYKVYGPNGGQITQQAADAIQQQINRGEPLLDVRRFSDEQAMASGLLHRMGEEIDAAYYEQVKSLVLRRALVQELAPTMKILYTPLHGTGNIPVRRVLRELGFSQVAVVAEQEGPDGNFPTVPFPNPEDPAVFALAIEQAKTERPDLIFATDPDCDRIGVLVREEAEDFRVLTGNQVGVLLCDYLIRTQKELGGLPANPGVIKTIVTSDMAKAICRAHGVHLEETLTGFKFIGEKIGEWEASAGPAFLFGFEESYGYLSGSFVRDKDAVIAAVLIAEMALYHRRAGLTLPQALDALYRQYGYYRESLVTVSLPGQEGQRQMETILCHLRENYRTVFAGKGLSAVEDYRSGRRVSVRRNTAERLALPCSDVLKFIFDDDSWIVVRPSGTEAKMKLYLSARASDRAAAETRLEALEALGRSLLSPSL